MVTWSMFKEIAKTKTGIECILTFIIGALVAVLCPMLIKKTSIILIVEIICAMVVSANTQKFAAICQEAVLMNQDEKEKLESYKKGYIRRKD